MRQALALLPGGPDESTQLRLLSSDRGRAEDALRKAGDKVVPRPRPSQYAALAAEVAGFLAGVGSQQRLLALLDALCHHLATPGNTASGVVGAAGGAAGAGAALAAALQEAAVWQSNARSWCARLLQRYRLYLDVVQPVQLAVQEACHGLALLSAAAALSPASSASSASQSPGSSMGLAGDQQERALEAAAALLSFPLHLPSSFPSPARSADATAASTRALRIPAAALGDASSVALLQSLASAAALASTPSHLEPVHRDRVADLAGYNAKLSTLRVALHAACRQALLSSSTLSPNDAPSLAVHADGTGAGVEGVGQLPVMGQLEGVWSALHEAWLQLKEFEASKVEEEGSLFKIKKVDIKSQEVSQKQDQGKGGC